MKQLRQLRAKLDLQAHLEIDTTDLERDERGRSNAHPVLVPIRYRDGTQASMLYIKLSMTGDEPQHVAGYQAAHPDFPHQTTADQFFDEAQFEAYRALGEHIGASLTGSDWIGGTRAGARLTLEGWLKQLEDRMLGVSGPLPWQVLDPSGEAGAGSPEPGPTINATGGS